MSFEETAGRRGRIPHGSVLCDFNGKKWTIGSFIKITGSTETYEAAPHNGKALDDYSALIKIEQRTNERLSSYLQFYIDNAKPNDIEDWIKTNNLQKYGLGMPHLLGAGSHEYNAEKYCFVALERYDSDVWQLFLENNRKLSAPNVYKISYKTMRVLEYIHSRGYVHADIKGANILLKLKNKVYLSNFALASKCSTDNSIVDEKNAHYSDMECASRDQHMGVLTKRGDIEMLLYNMIRWLCDNLPWDNNLNPSVVLQMKEDAFKYMDKFLQDCFITSDVPATIKEFMAFLASMNRHDIPDYTKLLTILRKGVKECHALIDCLNVHKEKEVTANLASRKTNKNGKTTRESPAMTNIKKLNHNNSNASISQKHPQDTLMSNDSNTLPLKNMPENQVGIRRSLRLKEKQRMTSKSNVTKRKLKDDKKRVVKHRKQKTKPVDEEDDELVQPNKPDGVDGNSNRASSPSQTECSGCSDLNSSKIANPPTPDCRSLPPTPLGSQRFHSPVSQVSSSGFNSCPSSQSCLLSEDSSQSNTKWHDTYEYLNVRLVMKDNRFKDLDPISSEPQMVAGQVQEFSKVLGELPVDSEGTQKLLDGVLNRWQTQLNQLEERGQKLSDACFYQLDSALQSISDGLKNQSLDKETEEVLLPKLKAYAKQLESYQILLTNGRNMAEQLSRVFSGSTLGSRIQAKFSSVNNLYQDLQKAIDARIVEVEKSFGDSDQLYEKCEEIIAWLQKELVNMPDNLLASADRKTLQEQLQTHEAIYQRISNKKSEVKELLNEGNQVFAKLPNLDDRKIGKRYLYLIQSQWNLLEMRSFKIHKKLQTCMYCRKKYDKAQKKFLPWLSNAVDELEKFKKTASLKSKDNIQQQQSKLSSFSYEVLQKSGDFEQNMELGHTFVSFCDKDKESVIKQEILPMEYQWKKLDNQLSECTELLQDAYIFNASLCDLKCKLEFCEHELISLDVVEKKTEDAKLVLSSIKKLQIETASLQEPLKGVRQQSSNLIPKARKQGIDINHLLDEMDGMTDRITALNGKLVENYNEFIRILEQKAVHVKTELHERRQVGRNIIRHTQIKSESTLQECIDLVSDDEEK